MTQGFDDENWSDVVKALAPLTTIQELLVRFGKPQDSGNAEYDSFTTTFPANSVSPILGFDLSRVRAFIRPVTAGAVLWIGKREILSGAAIGSEQGYPINAGTHLEIKSVTDVYGVFLSANPNDVCVVSVYVERSANQN